MRVLATLLLTLLVGAVVVLGYLYNLTRINLDNVIYYNPDQTTRIYDAHGELIANVFEKHHRLYATFDRFPPRMVEAVVAIEDTTFFEHHGVNFEAIFRAAYKVLKAGKAVEGASTITQQLVKNLVLTREKTIQRKLREAVLSMKVERLLSKEAILERYLNEIYFGHGYYGVKTAALGYFRKELSELTLKEIAMLVGLPRAPSFYDPTRRPKFALARANRVLERMKTLGWIGPEEYEKALAEEPTVYDDTLTLNRAPYVVDAIIAHLSNDYPDLKRGGYTVTSTVEMPVQEIAQQAVQDGRERVQKRLADGVWRHRKRVGDRNTTEPQFPRFNGALVSLRQETGEIIALVGGADHRESHFNRAIQGSRQLGSSFKPFIYLSAFDLGYSPSSMVADISRTYKYTLEGEEKTWKPSNYEENFLGLMPAREAVVHSRNLATINMVDSAGIELIYNKLISYGFPHLDRDLAFALGSHGMSPLELSRYYTIISNYGVRTEPFIVKSVEDRFGNKSDARFRRTKVTEPEQAYLILDVLRDTVQRGTGRRAKVANIEVAGKTGTTNENRDAWFCGFTPDTQTIIWYGNDDNTPIGRYETGGKVAGPVFKQFYTELLQIHPELKRRFDEPKGVYRVVIDGKEELFTETSPPPVRDKTAPGGEERILF